MLVSKPVWARRESWATRWRSASFLWPFGYVAWRYIWAIGRLPFDGLNEKFISNIKEDGAAKEEITDLQNDIELKPKF